MPHPRLTAFVLATVLLIAGCGHTSGTSSTKTTASTTVGASGSSGGASSQGGTLTRNELISKADGVCKRISAKRNLLKFSSATGFRLILPRIVAYQHALFSRLSKLTPPASMSTDWDQILANVKTLADSAAQLNLAAHTNKTQGASTLFKTFAQARVRLHSTALRDGMTDCGHY